MKYVAPAEIKIMAMREMFWRSSYLKWCRGVSACFTCSVAASWGGFWILSQLYLLQYFKTLAAIKYADYAVRPLKLRTNVHFCRVCKPI